MSGWPCTVRFGYTHTHTHMKGIDVLFPPMSAHAAVDAYNEVSLLFGVVSDCCLPTMASCQVKKREMTT